MLIEKAEMLDCWVWVEAQVARAIGELHRFSSFASYICRR